MKFAHALLAGAALAVATASSAVAADLLKPADPIYSSSLFNFEGLYVGGQAGGLLGSGGGAGTAGIVVGADFAVTDGILAGVEFQGDTLWDGGGFAGFSALGLARVGGYLSDNTVLYGDLGTGLQNGTAVYALGGGVEYALTGQLSIRGDLQGIGAWGAAPSEAKLTAGLLFHLN